MWTLESDKDYHYIICTGIWQRGGVEIHVIIVLSNINHAISWPGELGKDD